MLTRLSLLPPPLPPLPTVMGNVKGPVAKRTAQTRVAESLQVCPAEGVDGSSGVLRNDRGGGGRSAHGEQDRGSLSPQHWRGECEGVRVWDVSMSM